MKAIFFDLGDTLEHDGALLPGAQELLSEVRAMTDGAGQPVAVGLISNFYQPADAGEIQTLREQYLAILTSLGLLSFFEPTDRHVTLSSDSLDPDFVKPKPAIFRAALDKVSAGLPFAQALFVTEELPHVLAARALGMAAIHFKGPGQTTGEADRLVDLVPLIAAWLKS